MTGAAGPATTDPPDRARTAAALQSALAAENAAIYGYGVAGAQLGTAARAQALRDWTQHEVGRDQLQAMLTSLGVKPVAAQPAYRLPFPVHGTRAAISLAGYLENQVAAAYLGVVALDDSRLRTWGAARERACGMPAPPPPRCARRPGWAGPSPFPGWPPARVRPRPGRQPRRNFPRPAPARNSAAPARVPSPPEFSSPRRGARSPRAAFPWAVGPSRRAQLPCGADSTCATRSAALSSSVAAAIRSAHDHQNHQLPSSQQPA
jgi:hypothetical protein